MDELVALVVQKTGIGEDKARTAVESVVGYIKEKLPGPMSGQLDSLLAGGGKVTDMTSKLGGMASGLTDAIGGGGQGGEG